MRKMAAGETGFRGVNVRSTIFQVMCNEKSSKKGLKKGGMWFTMVSSGRKWCHVVKNGENVEPIFEEGVLDVTGGV